MIRPIAYHTPNLGINLAENRNTGKVAAMIIDNGRPKMVFKPIFGIIVNNMDGLETNDPYYGKKPKNKPKKPSNNVISLV